MCYGHLRTYYMLLKKTADKTFRDSFSTMQNSKTDLKFKNSVNITSKYYWERWSNARKHDCFRPDQLLTQFSHSADQNPSKSWLADIWRRQGISLWVDYGVTRRPRDASTVVGVLSEILDTPPWPYKLLQSPHARMTRHNSSEKGIYWSDKQALGDLKP